MKNVTLSAEEHLIEAARKAARERRTTLNAEFRKWLEDYTGRTTLVKRHKELMKELSYVDLSGRKFTREEMNERHPR
ncbi:MAG: hypothetical protein ACRD0Y_11970 [Terriglobales bacterium]